MTHAPTVPTQEQIKTLNLLAKAAGDDVMQRLVPFTRHAYATGGFGGATHVVIEVARLMVVTMAMAMRSETPESNKQDVKIPDESTHDDNLFCALFIAAEMSCDFNKIAAQRLAHKQFKQLTGREPNLPDWWQIPVEYNQ